MSLNSYVETPHNTGFTLESLGLATKDHLNSAGVLGEQTPVAPSAVINVDTTQTDNPVTSMNDGEIEQMPSWDAKVNIMKEHSNKLVDMKDIQKDIEDSGTMSDTKADVIHATFENYFTGTNPRSSYTPFNSKTNINYAKNFMSRRIRETTEALITEFREVNTNAIAELTKAIAETKDYCNEELRNDLADAVNKITAVRDSICAGPIMLPFNGDKFVDMTEANLTQIDIDDLKHGVPVTNEFRLAFHRMLHLWKSNTPVREIVRAMVDSNCAEDEHSSIGMEYLDIHDLITAFQDEASQSAYNGMLDVVDGLSTQAIEDADSIPETPVTLPPEHINIISNQAKDVLAIVDNNMVVRKNAMEFAEFAKSAAIVVVGLASLK